MVVLCQKLNICNMDHIFLVTGPLRRPYPILTPQWPNLFKLAVYILDSECYCESQLYLYTSDLAKHSVANDTYTVPRVWHRLGRGGLWVFD